MKIDLDMVSDSKQEVADLEEFVGHLINGMPVEKALERVWPNRQPKPTSYCSDVNGSLIGWDTCGGCNRHVSRCTCSAGPSEPAYFARLRHDDAIRKASAAGNEAELARLRATTTDVVARPASSGAPSDQGSSTSGPTEEESSTPEKNTQAASPATGPRTSPLVPCHAGKHLVEESIAERNDDGSWTCFEHQASAAVRDGAGDE